MTRAAARARVAVARGPGRHGGIFRRFRELAAYGASHPDRIDLLGLLLLGADDVPADSPMRTRAYGRRHISWRVLRAATVTDVLDACEPLIARLALDLAAERVDAVLAADTDLKGLIVVAAALRAGVPVTTFVAGLAAVEARYEATAPEAYRAAAERFVLERSTRLIFPSRFAAAHALADGLSIAPHDVIHNGIAAEFLDAPGPQPGSMCAGAVMRLSPVKNPEALGRIAFTLRAHAMTLEAVTDTTNSPAAATGLDGVRVIPPTLDAGHLAAHYARWRAVVCPSRFETAGNVPMEAIAAGTPAIVTDQMGAAELLRDLGLGHYVVAVDDIDATVDRVIHAEPVPDDVRRAVRERFAWPAIAERMLAVTLQLPAAARS